MSVEYAKALYADCEAFHALDTEWLNRRIAELPVQYADADPTAPGYYDFFAVLPVERSAALMSALADKAQRSTLSRDYLSQAVRLIELRRMHLYTVLVSWAMKHLSPVLEDDAVAPFLDSLCASLYNLGIDAGLEHEAAREMSLSQVIFHTSLAFHSFSGKPVYAPSVSLAEALIYTEFRDLPADMLKMPHDSVFIEAPAHCGLYVPNAETGNHPLRGLYVIRGHRLYTSKDSEDIVWGMQVLLIGQTKEFTTDQSGLFNDALMHFWIYAREGETLGDVLRRSETTPKNPVGYAGSIENNPHAFSAWSEDGMPRVIRFVMNTLLYITLPDAELDEHYMDSDTAKLFVKANAAQKGSTKRADLHKALAKADKQKVIRLGSSVRIDRKQPKDNGDGSSVSGHKLAVHYTRRGHWRKQPYGPRANPQTRLQWIRPTSVGPKNAPLSSIVYKIGAEGKPEA